jgi:hypothetical protein
LTLPSKFDSMNDCSDLRRAADVEGAHGQLGARLADRLGGDDADRFADVDRRAAGQIAPVAGAADAVDASQVSTERIFTLDAGLLIASTWARPSACRA